MHTATVLLVLRENLSKFSWLLLVNAFVGAMVGLELRILGPASTGFCRCGHPIGADSYSRRNLPGRLGSSADLYGSAV